MPGCTDQNYIMKVRFSSTRLPTSDVPQLQLLQPPDHQQTSLFQETSYELGMKNHRPEDFTRARTHADTMAGDPEAGTYESMTVPGPETTYVPSITPSTSTTITGSPSLAKDDDDDEEEEEEVSSCSSSLNAFVSRLRFPTTDDLVELGKYVLILFGVRFAMMCAVLIMMLLFLAFTELLLTCSENLKKVGGGGGGE